MTAASGRRANVIQRPRFPLLVAVAAWVATAAAPACHAGQDDDLIPGDLLREMDAAQTVAAEAPAAWSVALENVLFGNRWRDADEVILSQSRAARPDWSNLAQLGLRTEAGIGRDAKWVLDALATAEAADGRAFKARRDSHLHFKELYVSLPAGDRHYWDLGRIVIRNGVGTGFNPTDYFKTNALISRTSEDPSQLRTNRLGSFAGRWQMIDENSAWSFAYAPRIGSANPGLLTDASVIGQGLDRTNDRERALLRYAVTSADNLASDASLYSEDGRPQAGLNVSYGIGKKVLLLFEGNVARRRTLLGEGLSDSPVPLSSAIVSRFGSSFPYRTLRQWNLGGSYTGENNVTALLEFHYNEAGMKRGESKRYFEAARAVAAQPGGQVPLLLVRQLASTRQEPFSRRSLFARVTAPEAFHPDLTLTLLAVRDLEDRSRLVQAEAAWLVSRRTTARLRYATFRGRDDSNYGGNALESSLLLQVTFSY